MKKTIDNSLNRGNKTEIIGWGMPDYSAGVSVGDTTYTVPSNGWVKFRYENVGTSVQYATYFVNNVEVVKEGGYNADELHSMIFPVSKGDNLTVMKSTKCEATIQTFFPCKE